MYRTIDASLWTDRKVREQLPPLAKLFFVYLITNPHTHVSGLYYLPAPTVQHETGLSQKQVDTLSSTLSENGFAHFDRPNEVVWVVNMFNFQGRGLKNTLSAAYHLDKDVHNTSLINGFLERYPHVQPYMKNRVSDGASVRATPQSPIQRTEPEPEKEILPARGKFQNVRLTETQFSELGKRFGDEGTAERVEKLSEYMASKGKKYSNHYATILSWERRNGNGTHQQGTKSTDRNHGIPTYTPKQ